MAIEFRCGLCRAWNSPSRATCRKCGQPLQRAPRKYRVEVRLPDGRKMRKSCDEFAGIEEARQLEYELKRKVNIENPKPSEPTWGDVVKRYLRKLEVEEIGYSYQVGARKYLRDMSARWGDDCPISQISPQMIREHQLSLRERGLAPGTCDLAITTGRAAWNYADLDLRNPFSKVKLYNADNRLTRYLSPEERDRLLKAAEAYDRHWYEWIVVGLGTGLRLGNIAGLKRKHVNFQDKLITVRQKGGRLFTTPLSDGVAELLRQIPENGTEYFWINEKTGKPYLRTSQDTWYKIRRDARIDPKFRLHDLRHDFGTQIYSRTRDLKMAKEALGHSNIKTTERYAHLLPSHLRSAIGQVDPLRE